MAATACLPPSSPSKLPTATPPPQVQITINVLPDAREVNLANYATDYWIPILHALFDQLPHLESLNLSHTAITDRELDAIKSHPRARQGLVKLILNGCPHITGDGIIRLLNVCPLQYLSLDDNAQLNENDLLGIVRRGRSLRYLSLAGLAQVSDLILREIAQGCPELRGLILSRCPGITNVGVAEMARCSHLECLGLADCGQITSLGEILQRCQRLRRTDLAGSGVTTAVVITT